MPALGRMLNDKQTREYTMSTVDDVLSFWLEEVGPKGWYQPDPDLDATIRDRFQRLWEKARDGRLTNWTSCPNGCLAFLIVTDQFPRNMFRGDGRSFETDELAKTAACRAIDRGWDMRVAEPERQFFYLPFMHSECLSEQDRGVRLIAERMQTGDNLIHARAHREIIRRFNRFPYRNDALGRETTAQEQAFLEGGSYGAVLRDLQDAS
jgi:uncharacterized protein (DUF924 family)